MPDDILTLTEAARELGVTRARISQWLQAGRVPAIREERIVGVERRYLPDLAAQRRPSGRPAQQTKTEGADNT